MKIDHVDYFFEIFEKSSIPKLFSGIEGVEERDTIANPNYDENEIKGLNKIYSVFFIPDYLKPIYSTELFKLKKVDQFFKGYAIFLDGFESADAYIKFRFRSNAKGIRRRIKRLETCFDISYKTYYGNIKQEEYDVFMDCLHEMLVRRFEQRNDVSQTLTQWDRYKEMYFSLINEKKASLFVVLENNVPIVVSLNHHFEKRLFSAISSYDIDYGKFSLGSVEIYKKLDWCLANDHVSYEMGMGDLTYKREWCNHIYNFEHQIIYPQKSIIASFKASLEMMKVSVKEFIFKLAYVKYKEYKSKRKKSDKIEPTFKASAIENIQYNEDYPSVDFTTKEYDFLRNNVFDFLYSSIENVKDVSVVEVPKEEKTYLILGKSKMQKIAF
ncbi:GNAT family N-acetyltransferase [Aquimarina sp. AD10]|uniref:GNAT family N-acetyltransferase n=1 Tax=Aquimarina sp. AD10 TaxID=1714849 RepID=UPI000E4DD432|nr:GNAT family N-acetyltransferase [Aquimarina sp. AD10]AXT59917.1 GNAT family N-acetyltransferase [Aquimarina sp. AD10]RKM95636.1 GNAT family N-acetyltransferase [Aquimarina sp. AD10]